MFYYSPIRFATYVILCCILAALFCSTVVAQTDRQSLLDKTPLAEVAVQSLTTQKTEAYPDPNQRMMYQTEAEDPLSFYARTQDGEWLIPPQVNRNDPWVRLLLLGPVKPTIVDIAIEINQQPYRAAREQWIDKLLAEAKATFLVRTGVETAEAVEAKRNSDEVAKSEEESDALSDAEEPDTEEPNTEEANTDDEIPMVSAQSRQASTLFKRLINYLAADQSTAERAASREELRWLLAEWTGGPALLTLSPALAWRRVDAAPLWHALDRDGDQVLSREEIEQTMTTFKQADINRDDIVDVAELERLGKEHASSKQAKGYPLVVVIDENTDWKTLEDHLKKAYESPVEVSDLLSLPADVVARVSFASEEAKMALLAVNDSTSDSWQLHSSTEKIITVEQLETYVEISAAQGKVIDPENVSGDMQQTQVAVGAVVDGFPLFRLLDHDNNRQLTLRERRSVAKFLTSLDRNQDGQVDRRELPTAIRLAVTHGPQVHQHLAQAVAAQRSHDDTPTDFKAPAWFVNMDRNKDGDLSKREFQGSPAQFAKYDQDGDGLVSRAEIHETETQ